MDTLAHTDGCISIFSPTTADDSSHDQALSSRVALLHSTDLSLAHLGIEVGRAGIEVDSVVTACGESTAHSKLRDVFAHLFSSAGDAACVSITSGQVIYSRCRA
jgi:hypothetical protein